MATAYLMATGLVSRRGTHQRSGTCAVPLRRFRDSRMERSAHGVFDGLHRAGAHSLARRLRRELLHLLGKRIDAFPGRARRLLYDRELRKSRQHEHTGLLQFTMADLD